MAASKTLDILKNALLLERRGMAFYRNIASSSTTPLVKTFFELMAEEESNHIHILSRQFKEYLRNGSFSAADLPSDETSSISSIVLNPAVMNQIESAGFEAAAISAAMLMESHAVSLYRERASTAVDADEKALYQWLCNWEKSHLEFLSAIDRQLTETIWLDNQFWPF